MNCIIIRYGELSLKGKNRIFFEKRLIKNIKSCLDVNKHPYKDIDRLRNRIVIKTGKDCAFLVNVFGIVSFSPAISTQPTVEAIKEAVATLPINQKKFRVSTKRLHKDFPLTSMELDRKIGEFVINSKNCEVSLEKYDVEIGIEILKDSAFVFTQRIPCLGGLPLGVSGVAVSLIQDASDLVASWLMMKRGVLIYPVSQGNPDISILRKYCYGYQMSLHKSNTLQDIQSYMNSLDAKALVVGQTLKNFAGLQTDRLVLRPLIGYDQNQIKELYDKIK